jgi:hypothetical protein
MKPSHAIVLTFFMAFSARGAEPVDYLKEIKPLLATKCFACHGALKHESGLRLDAASLLRQGGDSGPAITPGDAEQSLLIHKVTAGEIERMPPADEGEPLTPQQIALVKAWIDQGAPAPDEPIPADPREHWAYQPITRPATPRQLNGSNPIDAFLAVQHTEGGIEPVGPASKEILLRRVYFDLIGLPPARRELRDFLADDSPRAYEKVVDRLLASPQYGERWGRHWMDVWRYSDWTGYANEIRYSQRHIWRWRDWIVESLNADKPYDRMILEMLAADEVAPGDEDAARAVGFLARNWYKFDRNSWLDDVVDHTGKAFLGMTIKCARCHDHKYDPISQQEFYALRAVFEPYDVRTDAAPGESDLEKNGLVRVYDAKPEAATHLFVRGDPKRPDKERAIAPGTPAIVEGPAFEAAPVPLPLASYYPAMRDFVARDLLAAARSAVSSAEAETVKAREQLAAAEKQLTERPPQPPASEAATSGEVFLDDDFSKPRSDVWTAVRGQWDYAGGHVVQKAIESGFSPLVTTADHPRDFIARMTFKPTGGNVYRSVGLSFDWIEDRDFQAVYLSAKDGGSTVSAFHRRGGADVYPAQAIVPFPIRVGQQAELEVLVREDVLNVRVDGDLKLAYRLPVSRQPGKFAIWTYDASAEFYHLHVSALPADASLTQPAAAPGNNAPPGDPLAARIAAEQAVALAQKKRATADANLAALQARIAAEKAKYASLLDPAAPANPELAAALATAAGRAERLAALADAEEKLLAATQELERARAARKEGDEASQKAATAAEEKMQAAEKSFADARKAAEEETASYQPLGPLYPESSTGRRTALARWIADRRNPLTARVAVNHIWLRHFGQPLVENVEDFGLRSPRPMHADLLDYLAAEFMESGWSMKHVHRLIVTSAAYQRDSAERGARNAEQNELAPHSALRAPHSIELAPHSALRTPRSIDPDNKLLWRFPVRRLEAEAVRDALFAVGGNLDLRLGGPDLEQTQGMAVPRRSLYFKHARERQMEFLQMFDAANPEECYRRRESVRPQQTFALVNSELAIAQSRRAAARLWEALGAKPASEVDAAFVAAAFETVLGRLPKEAEMSDCLQFLEEQAKRLAKPAKLEVLSSEAGAVGPSSDPRQRARENLVLVLLNHNDFVTVR